MKTFAWILGIGTLALGAGLLRTNSEPSPVTPAPQEQVKQTQVQAVPPQAPAVTVNQAPARSERSEEKRGEIGAAAPVTAARRAPEAEPFRYPVYRGTLLTEKVVAAEELLRRDDGKLADKDRLDLQRADHVTILEPPAGQKILAFKDIRAENCALLQQFEKPMALSVKSDGALEKAEFLHDESGDSVPSDIWKCRFAASGDFKGKAFMTVYVPQEH